MDAAESGSQQLLNEVTTALSDARVETLVFEGRVFKEPQHIHDVRFTKPVEFCNLKFERGLTLDFCEFEERLRFDNVSFGSRNADFEYCHFKGPASFRLKNAQLLSLRSGVFEKGLRIVPLREAKELPMAVNLSFAQIAGDATISVSDFASPTYEGRVRLGLINASNLILKKDSRLVMQGIDTFHLDLHSLALADKASVKIQDVHPDEFFFSHIETGDATRISFDRVDLAKAWFQGTSLEKIAISNATWASHDNRACLYEEIVLRDRSKGVSLMHPDANPTIVAIEQVATHYRQLVLNYEAGRNYGMAEHFHFGEMEMMRLSATLGAPAVFGRAKPFLNTFWLYRFLSIYGTSYRRAAAILCCLLALFTVLFLFNGVRDPKTSTAFDYDIAFPSAQAAPSQPLSVREIVGDTMRAAATALSIAALQKDRPLEPSGVTGSILTSLLQILAPSQAALLLFALRRKFRRASI